MKRLGLVCLFLSGVTSLQASSDEVNFIEIAEDYADSCKGAEETLEFLEKNKDNYPIQTYESLKSNLEKIRLITTVGAIASNSFAAQNLAEKSAASYKSASEAQNWAETKKGYNKGFFNNSKKSKK